jgi:hypothetical protein
MTFNFTTNIKKRKRCLISIPHKLCKKNNINLGDVVTVNIANLEFFGFITGTNSSKRIHLPFRIQSQIISREVIVNLKPIEKRKGVTTITDNKIDLYNSLPNKNIHYDWPLAAVKKNKEIIAWSPQAFEQTVPRYLELSEELFEVFGLIQGEGYKKTPVGGTRPGFVNSAEEIVNYVLEFFSKKMNVPKTKWSWFINYSSNEEKSLSIDNRLVEHWLTKTGVLRDNLKRINYLKCKDVRSSKNGVFHMFIPSCVLGEIYLTILIIAEKLSVKNRGYAIPFLRGLLAADGSATLHQYKHFKTLAQVELAIETEHEKELYKKIIKRIGLTMSDYSDHNRKFSITGWDNFLVLAKKNIFKLHYIKKRNFEEGFRNHKQTRMIIKYLSPLIKKDLTLNELFSRLKLKSRGALHQVLKVQSKRGLINRRKNKGKYHYYLTKKGKEILKFLIDY